MSIADRCGKVSPNHSPSTTITAFSGRDPPGRPCRPALAAAVEELIQMLDRFKNSTTRAPAALLGSSPMPTDPGRKGKSRGGGGATMWASGGKR